MSTANFANWDGNILDLGPIYPFVGWEVPMVIIGFVFWIGWHVVQIRMENSRLEKEAADLRKGDNLKKVVGTEHSPERM